MLTIALRAALNLTESIDDRQSAAYPETRAIALEALKAFSDFEKTSAPRGNA